MEVTEAWVRGLTGWKPFKDGKAMADQGRIADFKQLGSRFQGSIREGRMTLRPSVMIAGPSDVRVQCGCPDFRASGGVCAHAVAVLMTSLASSAPSKEAKTGSGSKSVRPAESFPRPWQIRLSPRFDTEWEAGRLSLRLTVDSSSPIVPADTAISAWLDQRGLAGSPLAIRLEGAEMGEFLDLASGHPRIEIEGGAASFEIWQEPARPLRLAESRLDGSEVVLDLHPDEKRRKLVRWGKRPAWATPRHVARLPASPAGGDPNWLDRVVKLSRDGKLRIPSTEFLSELDAWLDLLEAPHPGWLGQLRMSGGTPGFQLDLEGSPEALTATLAVQYPGFSPRPLPDAGEALVGLPSLAPDGQIRTRRIDLEEQARRQLLRAGFAATRGRATFDLRGKDAILGFIADVLPDLRRQWAVREGERLAPWLSRVRVVRPDLQKTSENGTSLSFELSFQTEGGSKISNADLRRLLTGGRRRATLKSGVELVVSRDCDELVQPLIAEAGIVRYDEQFHLSGAQAIVFEELRKKLSNQLIPNSLSNISLSDSPETNPEDFDSRMRNYQVDGARWLLDRIKRLGGALLADEMGLGKTIQTIAAIGRLKLISESPGQSLIVVPASLLDNWMSELEKFGSGLKCFKFHGGNRDEQRGKLDGVDVIVTSYQTLARDLAFHLKRHYRLLVADEASLLRNPDAEVSKAIAKVVSDGRVALTGTPVENRAQDLWALFRFVAPGYLGDRKIFRERYETEVSGAMLERLRLRISPYVLRRTKEQVAADLPEKIQADEWLAMEGGQAQLYASLARSGLEELDRVRQQGGEAAGRMHLLTLLLRLRQTCVNPALLGLPQAKSILGVKIERLKELLEERYKEGRKTLVFSQFAVNLRMIEERLESVYGAVFRLDGSTRDRQRRVDEFQAAEGAAVFLISLKAGGYGLNLTAADTVVHLDPWWNPAVEAQATDRAHRIGQTRPVTVIRLLTRGTVEERVRRMQEQKQAVIDAAIGDGDAEWPTNWNTKDLEELLT